MIVDVWRPLAIVALVSLLALYGCDNKKETASPEEQAPAPTVSSPSVNLQDGEWAITSKVEMPGMPAAAMKPYTVKTCLTKEHYVPESGQEQSDCTMEDQKIDGNTVSWKMVCKETTGKGTVTYSGDSMEGLMESSTKVGGREMITKITMSGKRLGPCPTK